MKRIVLGVLVLMLIFSFGFVSAIPENFEISNVYWASNGTMDEKPFLFGLVELSWNMYKKGSVSSTSSVVAYFNYDGEEYYSYSSLGLVKNEKMVVGESQLFPLENFASGDVLKDKFSIYSFVIPISENWEIDLDGIEFSKIEDVLSIPDSFRVASKSEAIPGSSDIIEESNINDYFSEYFVSCGKRINYESGSQYDTNNKCFEIEKVDDASVQAFWDCMDEEVENVVNPVESVTFNCDIRCIEEYSENNLDVNEVFGGCRIYTGSDIVFDKVSSDEINLDSMEELNPDVRKFNPWRDGP